MNELKVNPITKSTVGRNVKVIVGPEHETLRGVFAALFTCRNLIPMAARFCILIAACLLA